MVIDQLPPVTRTRVRSKRKRSKLKRLKHRFHFRRRTIVMTVGGVFLALVAWAAFDSFTILRDLQAAQRHAVTAKNAIINADTATANTELALAQEFTTSAHDSSNHLGIMALSKIPVLGRPLAVVRDTTAAVHQMSESTLASALKVAELVSTRLSLPGGGLDLNVLRDSRQWLDAAQVSADESKDLADDIPSSFIPLMDSKIDDIKAEITNLAREVHWAQTASKVLPSLLGADGPRTYFLGFQTNAEARGTTGLIGGSAIAIADQGKVRVEKAASSRALDLGTAPLDLGPQFAELYGGFEPTTRWQNSNISPHFPYAAEIWRNLWNQQSEQLVDGVVGVDPISLSYILQVIGPVTMDSGEVITAENVVPITLSSSYVRFADDNTARKAYLSEIAALVAEKAGNWSGDFGALARALGKGVSEGRIMAWSSRPNEQVIIEQTPFAHSIPYSPAPYANIVVSNSGGNKLDLYLEREFEYTGGKCEGETRATTASLTLTNTVPAGELPAAVTGSMFLEGRQLGDHRLTVTLYSTWGASLERATVNGKQVGVKTGFEEGHPVYQVLVDIPRGKEAKVDFNLVEPVVAGTPTMPIQPLVAETAVRLDVPECKP